MEPSEAVQSIRDLKPKMQLKGTVKSTQLYGAIVDVGLEHAGLIHISQLSRGRVNRVEDVVKAGDTVTVWVTEVEPDRGRIGLTLVEPPDVSWQDLKVDQVLAGKVTRLERYGAFVDIGAERDGLLHVGEMASGYVEHPSEIVQLGEEIDVRILKVDRRRKRIDLGMPAFDYHLEDEEDQEPTVTAMEIALERARAEKADQKSSESEQGRRGKERPPELVEREAILAQTLKQHAKD